MGHKYVKENETFNTSRNGTVPKPTGQEVTDNKFLRADGTWASGAGGSVVSADQVVTSGTEIGGVTVDGVRTAFYAPNPEDIYSTTEQAVGKWANGATLYKITYHFNNIVNVQYNAWTSTNITNTQGATQIIRSEAVSDGTANAPIIAGIINNVFNVMTQRNVNGLGIEWLTLWYIK